MTAAEFPCASGQGIAEMPPALAGEAGPDRLATPATRVVNLSPPRWSSPCWAITDSLVAELVFCIQERLSRNSRSLQAPASDGRGCLERTSRSTPGAGLALPGGFHLDDEPTTCQLN